MRAVEKWLLQDLIIAWFLEEKLRYTTDWGKIVCTCCVLNNNRGFTLATIYLDGIVVSAPKPWENPYAHRPNPVLYPENPDFLPELKKQLVEAHRDWYSHGHLWKRRDA